MRSASTPIARIGEIAHGLASDAGIRVGQVTFAVGGEPRCLRAGRGEVALVSACRAGAGRASSSWSSASWGRRPSSRTTNLAALGERWHGLGKDVQDFVYLHLGTGVGLGIIVNGELTAARAGRPARSGTSRCGRPTCATRGTPARSLDIAASAAGGRGRGGAGMTVLTAERVFAAAAASAGP